MKKIYCLLLLFSCVSTILYSQEKKYAPGYFYGREYRLDGDTLRYRAMFPEGYEHDVKFPLFIFLHGEDQKGSDNVLQLKHGSELFANKDIRDWSPAVVLFPQCPEDDSWALYDYVFDGTIVVREEPEQTKVSMLLEKLINLYANRPYVDKNRIYIVGMDMGAFGALDLAARNPKLFTAVVAMDGAIEPARMKKCKKTAFRIYHGVDDKVVPITMARDVFYELKSAGANAEMIEVPETGHEAWKTALISGDFLEWIFSNTGKK